MIRSENMQPNLFMRIFNWLRGRDPVAEYYSWLTTYGRITEGWILDAQQDSGGMTVFYQYKIANVDYETSQKLSTEQIGRQHLFAPGKRVTIRYDPRNPGSSVIP